MVEDEEVTEGDPIDSNPSNSLQQELRQEVTPKQQSPGRHHMDVDAKVNDLLTNFIEHGTEKQSNGANLVKDFLQTLKNYSSRRKQDLPFTKNAQELCRFLFGMHT